MTTGYNYLDITETYRKYFIKIDFLQLLSTFTANTHTHTHTHTQTLQTYTQTHTDTHAQTQTHTHTHTHTRTTVLLYSPKEWHPYPSTY